MNELLERCAGMDVHKKTITVCILVGFGKNAEKLIRTFGTTTDELLLLAEWLRSHNIKETAIESTGVYWKCVYNILEKDFDITLANPRHMKNIPGKKTDVKDSEWICKLLKHGFLAKSFIPPKNIRDLRDLTRLRKKHTQLKNSAANRIIKFLESANIKLKSIVSHVGGTSSWNIIKAIASGVTDPNTLASLVKTRLRASKQEIINALTGVLSSHDIMMVRICVEEVEFHERQMENIDIEIKKLELPIAEPLEIVRTFPGVGEISGAVIVAEIGTNMKQFPSGDHLASWAGIAPGNNESAGKTKSTRISKGNNYLKVALLQVAWGAVREVNGYWRSMYYNLKSRLGAKKAAIAIARKILKAIYNALTMNVTYEQLNLKISQLKIQKSIEYHAKKLAKLTELATV